MPRNWYGFGSLAGFPIYKLRYWNDARCRNPFLEVFDEWSKDGSKTLGEFVDILIQLKRFDIMDSEKFRQLAGTQHWYNGQHTNTIIEDQ